MYTIKQTPEDFKVTELACWSKDELKGGEYTYCLMEKRNLGTLEAISQIASQLKIQSKNIGFAGNKDKKAVTSQYISVKGDVTDLSFGDITVTVIGKSDMPIHLGYLEGNAFEIVVRDVLQIEEAKKKMKTPFVIPNLFGQQRFSTNNASVGKALITGDFKEAVRLVLEQKGHVQDALQDHLHSSPTDVVGALRRVPGKLLMLYVHAYQSLLFNELVGVVEKDGELPLIGFGTELDEFSPAIEKAVEAIMDREGITFRNFVVRALPEISSEGTTRKAFVEIADFTMEMVDEDALLKFTLPKNSYATVVVEYLFGEN
ncbi:MAG: tRNA pseudouridine(13) synthase TruD [Nanoarchaeota archaeon]|nr:tRNA pseudouridine(13) synthase TruD [Nanoarchaeota archaeon]